LPWAICGALGLGICAAGFWLINRSKRELDAADQPSLPGAPTTRLITKGPFAYSRNPNYLGAMIAGIGFALLFDALWVFAALSVGAFVLEVWMIRPEERYLAERFREENVAYTKATRRWF
jgi:protein-S-isoprenylcysteine O-methyltransferase Ste14